jgi:hypothetical protein
VFENRTLRKIYGRKGEEVRGDWRKLFIGELHDLYLSPYVIQVIRSVQGFGWET